MVIAGASGATWLYAWMERQVLLWHRQQIVDRLAVLESLARALERD